MKKKIIAIVSLAALLLGLVAGIIPAVSASAEVDDRFQVGYSKKDINPWIKSEYTGELGIVNTGFNDPQHIVYIDIANPNNTAQTVKQPIIAVPMAGYGDPTDRLANQMADDNGDGVVGFGDGLFVTCTAVTDQRDTTVLYITLDALHTYEEFYNEVIPAVSSAVGVPESNIMFSTSHNHEGPEYDYLKWYGKGSVNGVGNYNSWGAYFDYAKAQIVAAAVAACADRTEAQMYKGEIDATDATKVTQSTLNGGKGLQMNSVRHYYMKNGYGGWRYFVGSNEFNDFGGKITTSSGEHVYNDGNTPYGNVAESNDTMYLLEFVPTDGADPIVLVNWRAHPSFMGGEKDTVLSSDYINFLRNYLEDKHYRVAFFQGAAGNINPRDLYNQDCWSRHTGFKNTPTSEEDKEKIARTLNNCRIYGTLLGEIAEYGLANAMGEELPGGTIRLMHDVFEAETNAGNKTVKQPIDVIALGKQVMMVVGAGEYFDRYDANYATNYANTGIDPTNPTSVSMNVANYTANDWDKLVDEDTYGTPFFFGYSTAHNNYVPNTMAYDYNDNLTNKTTPTLDGGTTVAFQTYSYEATVAADADNGKGSCNDMKRGEGEKIIARMAEMVKVVSTAQYAECAYCGQTVLWTALDSSNAGDLNLSEGHYYLAEDITGSNARSKRVLGTVCLDLNGKTFAPQNTTNGNLRGTPFTLEQANAVLNIMDNSESDTVGKLIGIGDAEKIGGVVSVWGTGAECNLYSGVLEYNGAANAMGNGGAVYVNSNATFNMYGGTIQGKAVYGYGATVFVHDNAQFNMYGGNLIKGSAENGGDCVYLQTVNAKFLLAGNATVDEIMFSADQSGTTSLTNLTVKGGYTGTAKLAFDTNVTPSDGMTLGSAVNATIRDGAIHYTHTDGVKYHIVVDGSALKMVKLPSGFTLVDAKTDERKEYESLTDLLKDYNAGGTNPETATKYIKLYKDIEENLSINQDVYLDLNGYSISGIITVAVGKTLYCMDSKTDDYDVADDNYGRITGELDGNLLGIPEGCLISPVEIRKDVDPSPYRAGYLKITETVGGKREISFHRVDLDLTDVTFRPEDLGIAYISHFSGDQVVARNVVEFGVALSILEAPNAANLQEKCGYSTLTGFEPGGSANIARSTRLINIIRESNATRTNQLNAEIKIYGSAYLKTKNDGDIFGAAVSQTSKGDNITLRWAVEQADKDFLNSSETRKANTLEMYNKFKNVMNGWNIPNIKDMANN